MLAILIIWFWFTSNRFTKIRYWPLSLYLPFLELFSLKYRYIFRILSNIYDEVFMRNECFRISPLNYHTSDAYSLNNFKIKNEFFSRNSSVLYFFKVLKSNAKNFQIQEQLPQAFYTKRCSWKFHKIHMKTPVPESLF